MRRISSSLYVSHDLAHTGAYSISISMNTAFLRSGYCCYQQRYRRTGPQRRFRLGITAPLPPLFVALCHAFEMPIPEGYVRGGVYIDGVRVMSEGGAIPELEGRWLRPAYHTQ
jgi:hypothetical protein